MGGVNHIDNVYQQAGDYKTCYHRQHIFPIGKQHYCHGEGYLVIFYFEYAVRTSAYFNEIIVDGSQYGEATAKAEQLEERNGRPAVTNRPAMMGSVMNAVKRMVLR